MTFGSHHAALFAEYRSLMDEEVTLWNVISTSLEATEGEPLLAQPDGADLERWRLVRARRAQLDAVIDALSASRVLQWADVAV